MKRLACSLLITLFISSPAFAAPRHRFFGSNQTSAVTSSTTDENQKPLPILRKTVMHVHRAVFNIPIAEEEQDFRYGKTGEISRTYLINPNINLSNFVRPQPVISGSRRLLPEKCHLALRMRTKNHYRYSEKQSCTSIAPYLIYPLRKKIWTGFQIWQDR